MSTARKILGNTAAQVMGRVFAALLGIISVKLITNYLSPGQYGEYTAIYDYTALFAIVADFGLFTIAVREMSKSEELMEKILGNVLSVRTFLGLASLGLGAFVAFFIPAYQESLIPVGIIVVSISTLLMLMAGTISSVLQVHLKMQWSAFAIVFGKAVTVAYIAAAIFWWFPNDPTAGFMHLLYAWVIGLLFTIAITYIPSKRLAHISFRFDFDFWKEVVIQALPYGIALILGSIYFRTGSVLMSFFGLKEDVGIYGVAMRIIEIAVIIPAFFMNSVLPSLTRSLNEAKEKTKRIMQYCFDFMALASFPVLVGGFVLATPLIAAISREEFTSIGGGIGSDTALSILLFGMAFVFFHQIFNYTLVAMGQQKKVLLANFSAAVFNVILNIYLIPRYGFIGSASVAVITEIIVLFIGSLLVYRLIKFSPRIILFGKAFFSAIIMGGVVFLLREPFVVNFGVKSLIVLIPLGALVYLGLLLLLKTFTPEMLSFVSRRKD